MASATLNNVLKVFGAKPTEQEQSALAEEVMLMTLSRATAADTNIKEVEVEMVRSVLEKHPAKAIRQRTYASLQIQKCTRLHRYRNIWPASRTKCAVLTKCKPSKLWLKSLMSMAVSTPWKLHFLTKWLPLWR